MSYYKQGLHTASKSTALEKQAYRSGIQVGALIATPGYIRDQVNALDGEYHITDAEVWTVAQQTRQGAAYDWYVNTWAPLMDSWKKFHDEHQSTFSNLWGSTVDTINDYRQRLIDARKAYRSMGGSLTSPDPIPPEEGWMAGLGHAVEGVGHFVKNVIYVLLAMVGGFMVYKFYVTTRSAS